MPPKPRFRRKDLRRPDEFVTQTSAAIRYAQEHARTLSWIAVAAGILIIAVFVFVNFQRTQRARAERDFASAFSAFGSGDYSDAVTKFEEFGRRWGAAEGVRTTNLYVGQAQLALGHYQEAITSLQEALASLRDDYLRQQALLSLGYAMEGQGDHAGAAARFDEAAALSGPYAATALFGAARNYELAGDTDRARDTYTRLSAEFPDTAEKPLAELQLQKLG